MRWVEGEDECRLEEVEPILWVWLLQLPQIAAGRGELDYAHPPDGPHGQDPDWEEFVRPDLEDWQDHCLEAVERCLRASEVDSEGRRRIAIANEDLDHWLEVLGRARLRMEQRWELSQWRLAEVAADLGPQRADKLGVIARFDLYQKLEWRLVERLGELVFEGEDDALGCDLLGEFQEEGGDSSPLDWGDEDDEDDGSTSPDPEVS